LGDNPLDKLGYINGTVFHIAHGSNKNRFYGNRSIPLHEDNFDPSIHLEPDGALEVLVIIDGGASTFKDSHPNNFLYRWTDKATNRMKKTAKDYYWMRKEDEN
jgi:hypothetical protein